MIRPFWLDSKQQEEMKATCYLIVLRYHKPPNKNIKVSSFESNENTQRQSVGHIAQFRIQK